MLLPDALAAKKKRWALVYPNFEYGQSAAAAFKEMMKAKQPDVEFVTEQASAARQDRCRRGGAGDRRRQARRDFQRAVRRRSDQVRPRGLDPRHIQGSRRGRSAGRRAGISRSAEGRGAGRAGSSPAIPGTRSTRPSTRLFSPPTRNATTTIRGVGSIVGYLSIKSLAAGIAKAGSTDTDKLVEAFAASRSTARSARSRSAPAIIRRRWAPSSARSRSRTATAP